MGRFAQGGGVDPNILAALQARMPRGGMPGSPPNPAGESPPWAPPAPQGGPWGTGPTDVMETPPAIMPPARGGQDLSGVQSRNGVQGVVGRGGNFQPLGAAAQRRMPPPAPPSGPIAMPGTPGPALPDTSYGPIRGNPDSGMPQGPFATTGDGPGSGIGPIRGNPDSGMPQAPFATTGDGPGSGIGLDMPQTSMVSADPRIMDVIDRVRMNPVEQPAQPFTKPQRPPRAPLGAVTNKAGKTDIAEAKGGGAMRPPSPAGKPTMPGIRPRNPPAGGVGGAQLPPGNPAKPGASSPPQQTGFEAAGPMGKPGMPPMQGAPEGPAFDDMLAKLRQQGGIGGTAVRPPGRRFAMGELLPGQVAR